MKKTIIVIVVLVVVGVGLYYTASKPTSSVPVSNTSVNPEQENFTVDIKNFSFNPSTLTVKTGTKVTWTNNDSVPHTVTSDSGNLLNSATLSPGQSFSFTFTNIGSVNYHCAIHPTMKGKVIIEK